MKFKSIIKTFAIASMALGLSTNANAICLDYWLKGPSACKGDPEAQKKKIIIKGGSIDINAIEKDEARVLYEKNLNVKIDKFIEGYGKPPREFVAFHLDPTLENAIRWVKKFETDYDRTRKIAVSWRQADVLFKQYKKTGSLTLPPESGVSEAQIKYLLEALEEDATELREVEGFGKGLVDDDWEKSVMSAKYAKLDYKANPQDEYSRATSKMMKSGANSDYSLKALEKRDKDPKEAKKNADKNKPEQLEISYYFSVKCPFCNQYKPELAKAIKEYGKENVKLTCVDMTPGDRKPENLKGELDCKWRPLLAGEASEFGVKITPSILVKRGNADGLELLENFHKSKALIKYFKQGA